MSVCVRLDDLELGSFNATADKFQDNMPICRNEAKFLRTFLMGV